MVWLRHSQEKYGVVSKGAEIMPATRKTGRLRSKFICQVEAGTMLAIVFAYLNGNLSKTFSQREGKQRATDALLAFWKPYALKAQKADAQIVQEAAQTSVQALLWQMQMICDDFGIPSPVARSAIDVETLIAALAGRIQSSADLIPTAEVATPVVPLEAPSIEANNEVIFVDDDDLLDDLA